MQLKTNIIIILLLMSAIPVTAVQPVGMPVPADTQATTVSIPYSHPLYGVKIAFEGFQEWVTFNPVKKLLLKQAHLNNRLNELNYEATVNNNTNSAWLIQRIQLKLMDVDAAVEAATAKGYPCIEGVPCDANVSYMYTSLTSRNHERLLALINNPKMPAQSRNGLLHAINVSGIRSIEVISPAPGMPLVANMSQTITTSAVRMIPFKSANIYVYELNRWYSAVVYADSITLSDQTLAHPEVTIALTQAQLNKLITISNNVQRGGTLSWRDKFDLMRLWFKIKTGR